MRANEFINEVNIDNRNGAGATPNNADIDYFGLRVKMKPSTWLKMAGELQLDAFTSDRIEKLADYIKDGGSIGAPFFLISIPPEWEEDNFIHAASIYGHEGRHRMNAILAAEGDNPVEVHLFPMGGLRARHITPKWIQQLNKNIVNERGQLVTGPWFEY